MTRIGQICDLIHRFLPTSQSFKLCVLMNVNNDLSVSSSHLDLDVCHTNVEYYLSVTGKLIQLKA